MCWRALCSSLVVALVAPGALLAQDRSEQLTTITHVTVIDLTSGRTLPDREVVLQGDRIVSLDGPDSGKAPEGRVIDGQGAFLIPGLWDMHVHIQDLEDLPLYIANGITGVRMMFGVRKPKELRAKFATGGASPEVIVGSIILDGDPPVWEGSILIHKPDDARRVVDEVKASGADFIYIGVGAQQAALFLKQAAQGGLKIKVLGN